MDIEIKKKLPEFRMIIDNQEYFKLSLALIFYTIYYSTNPEAYKIAEYFSLFINNIFNLDTSRLLDNLFLGNKTNAPNINGLVQKDSEISKEMLEKASNTLEDVNMEIINDNVNLQIFNDKELNYLETLDQLKNKSLEKVNLDKFYNIDKLASLIRFNKSKLYLNKVTFFLNIFFIMTNSKLNKGLITNYSNKPNSENDSVISLTPSLESQENGKTYKDIILMDETSNEDISLNKNSDTNFFYPIKTKSNILFFTNEHYYVTIRYIFCIYERLNKLADSSAGLDFFIQNSENFDRKILDNMTLLKNYVTIYKAFLHKKLENSNIYEEYCRDILGNESYFLLNVDKLINSVNKNYY